MDDNSGELGVGMRKHSTDSIDKELDWLIENEQKQQTMQSDEDDEPKVSREAEENEKSGESPQGSPRSPRSPSPVYSEDASPRSPSSLGDRTDTSDAEDDPDNLELTADQEQAMQELHNMKLDLAYTDEEPPPDYDVTERVRQLNEELAKDPTPLEDERERSIKFKDNLVDLVAPPVDYSESEEEGGESRSPRASPRGQQQPPESEDTVADPGAGGDGSHQNSSNNSDSNQDDDKTLVERNGKFELVSAKDLSPEERQLYGLQSPEPSEGDSSNAHQPHPPSAPRPSTANGTTTRGHGSDPKGRRAQSASHTDTVHRGGEFDANGFNYRSPYAMSDEEKRKLAKERRSQNESEKERQQREKREAERNKEDSDDAFKSWLRQKRDDAAERRKQDKERKSQEDQEKKANVSEEDDDDEEHDSESAFQEWVKVKKQQKKKEAKEEQKKQKEGDEGWYVRPRNECSKAFKEWVKKKNADLVKARKEEKQKARIHRLLARRSHKSLALARAIKQSQSFRYVDYYGYRF